MVPRTVGLSNAPAVGSAAAAAYAGAMTAPWAIETGEVLAHLGFSLLDGDRPEAPGGCHLMVAFRATPTERHFDPEEVACWVAASGRGVAFRFARKDAALDRTLLWGHVHVVDRFEIENRFLTFGGRLRTTALDATTTVADLTSPGPIVRWGGHSQGSDPLAAEVGAFFGRLIVPVEEVPGAEARLSETPALVLYATFLRSIAARLAHTPDVTPGGPTDPLGSWRIAETSRLRAHEPDAWAAAGELLTELGLH